jgi:hypothetical protein
MDLAAMREANAPRFLARASSSFRAKTESLRRWILSCRSKSGLASAMAARAARIRSLAWRSSRRSAWSDWPWEAGSGREEEVAVEGGEEAEVPRAVEV